MMLCPETVSLLGVKQYFDELPGAPLVLLAWETAVLSHDQCTEMAARAATPHVADCTPIGSFARASEGLESEALQAAKVQRLLRVLSSTTFHQVQAAQSLVSIGMGVLHTSFCEGSGRLGVCPYRPSWIPAGAGVLQQPA